MIDTVIVDDEKLARDLVKDYMAGYPELKLAGAYEDGLSGLKAINKLKPDLVFLDIQMPKITGFELLELLDHHPAIIFTTAYDQYAIKAFEHNAADYLLKPFSRERFGEAVEKAMERIAGGGQNTVVNLLDHMNKSEESLYRVVVKSGSRIHVIPVGDIIFLEAQDDYVMIHTREKKYLKQKTMKYFESRLPEKDFIRVHRSSIVRIDEITHLELYEKDSYIVILKNGLKLPVSKTGLPKLKNALDF